MSCDSFTMENGDSKFIMVVVLFVLHLHIVVTRLWVPIIYVSVVTMNKISQILEQQKFFLNHVNSYGTYVNYNINIKSIPCFANKRINDDVKASASRYYRKKDYDTSKRN